MMDPMSEGDTIQSNIREVNLITNVGVNDPMSDGKNLEDESMECSGVPQSSASHTESESKPSEIISTFTNEIINLKCNDLHRISKITMLASHNDVDRDQIVQIILNESGGGLLLLYVLDSIMKNVGRTYISIISKKIVGIFKVIFENVDTETRLKMYKLRDTWTGVLSPHTLLKMDKEMQTVDVNWPKEDKGPINCMNRRDEHLSRFIDITKPDLSTESVEDSSMSVEMSSEIEDMQNCNENEPARTSKRVRKPTRKAADAATTNPNRKSVTSSQNATIVTPQSSVHAEKSIEYSQQSSTKVTCKKINSSPKMPLEVSTKRSFLGELQLEKLENVIEAQMELEPDENIIQPKRAKVDTIVPSKSVRSSQSNVAGANVKSQMEQHLKRAKVDSIVPSKSVRSSQSNVAGVNVKSQMEQLLKRAKVDSIVPSKSVRSSQSNVAGVNVKSQMEQHLKRAKVDSIVPSKSVRSSQSNVAGVNVKSHMEQHSKEVRVNPIIQSTSVRVSGVNDQSSATDDSILPQYSSPDTSQVQVSEPAERRKRCDKRWKKEATFHSYHDAIDVVKSENCWSKATTNKTYEGDSVLYRCNKVKSTTQQCSSGIYLFYHADSANVSLFRSQNEHDCDTLVPRGKSSMTEEQKNAIVKCLHEKQKRKEIMNSLYLDGIPVPTKNQLNNFIVAWNKENNGPPVILVSELLALLKERVAVPDDSEDESFVVVHRVLDDEDEISFDFLVSSKKLLRNAIGQKLFACDGTNKIMWQGFPVIPIGTMDMDRHFHLIAVGCTTHERTENFEYFFDSLKTRIFDIFKVNIGPEILIADGAKAIQNAFKAVFGMACLILMCWFHMKKAFLLQIKSLLPKSLHDEVVADLGKLQISQNPDIFGRASKLFLEKYGDFKEFVEYFEYEWLDQNKNWYEGASPHLVPSTNNAEETWNRLLKDEKTLRRRLPLQEFVKNIHLWVESWSVEYDSGAKPKFVSEPTIDLKLWTRSYQWVHLKRVIKKKSSDPAILMIPSSESINAGYDFTLHNFDAENDEWQTFNDFKNSAFVVWKVGTSNDTWSKWTCDCPAFQKQYICKHIVGVALRMKLATAPDEAKNVPIGTKRKRGRPSKAKKALLIQ